MSETLQLQKIRLQLKHWELEFQEKNGTKPSKADINSAPNEIKDAYKLYYQLRVKKTPTSEVWGNHLNKGVQRPGSDKKQVNHLDYYSNKLKKAVSSEIKGLPERKELGKSKPANEKTAKLTFDEMGHYILPSVHQPPKEDEEDTNNVLSPVVQCSNEKTLRIVNRSSSRLIRKGQPLNVVGLFPSDHQKTPLRHSFVSIDWVKRCSQEDTLKEVELPDRNEEPKTTVHSTPGEMTPCLDLLFHEECLSSAVKFRNESVQEIKSDSNLCVNLFPENVCSPSEKMDIQHGVQNLSNSQIHYTESDNRTTGSICVAKLCNKDKEFVGSGLPELPCTSMDDELNSDGMLYSENLEKCSRINHKKIPESLDNSSNQELQSASRLKNTPLVEDEDYLNSTPANVKRKRKIPTSPINAPSAKSATERKKRRLIDKMNSGTANENFVRIDLKRKVYTRGKKQFSGGKYKRQQWKNRQRLQEAGGGARKFKKGTCFHCGEKGHWATNCPKKKEVFEETVPGRVDGEEECPFLTLEEAAALARGIKPNTKPKEAANTTLICSTENLKPSPNKKLLTENNSPGEYDFLDETFEDENIGKDNSVQGTTETDLVFSSAAVVTPYFELEDDGTVIATPQVIYATLSKFGYKDFRPGQEVAIMRILSGLTTLLVLATGAGKSLCYQLPAYLYAQREKCITLVISPLVSLMEDQVTGLPACLKAACLHTGLSTVQRQKVCDAVTAGKVHVLLISPEAAVAGSCLPRDMPPVAFACIDEAHCVSQWSHNFRPSYLRLCKVLRDKFSVKCIIGLTATATKSTAQDIAKHLGIAAEPNAVVHEFHFPDNLVLSVSRDQYRDEALVELLKGDRFADCASVIVYCTRREQTERIAVYLRTKLQDCAETQMPIKEKQKRRQLSWTAEAYHAGLTAGRRRTVQNLFMSGKLRIVVATVAFGMGLDKADVRAVIHYNMPKSFEGYVQEVGRAGRDGLQSHCHLFLDSEGHDICELRRHIFGNSCDRSALRKLVRQIFHSCKCQQIEDGVKGEKNSMHNKDTNVSQPCTDSVTESLAKLANQKRACPGHEAAVCIDSFVRELDMKQENIETLLCYLELVSKKLLEVLNLVYSTCTIRAYGGHKLLKAAARKCPPLAAAIAIDRLKGISHDNSTELVFPVVAVASQMAWDSGIVKRELKALEWNTDLLQVSGRMRKSGLLVEFSDLSFHFNALGDLSEDEQDCVLNYIHTRVVRQEQTELLQLRKTFEALRSVSFAHYWSCCDTGSVERSNKLKSMIMSYFEEGSEALSNVPANQLEEKLLLESYKKEDAVRADVRRFVCTHSDHSFSGRAVARIFSGIPSPCFPSEVWGRVRQYWRCHLDVDFNLLCKWAAEEIMRLK